MTGDDWLKRVLEEIFKSPSHEPRPFHATLHAAASIFQCEESEALEVAYQKGYNISYIGGGWFSFIPSDV